MTSRRSSTSKTVPPSVRARVRARVRVRVEYCDTELRDV